VHAMGPPLKWATCSYLVVSYECFNFLFRVGRHLQVSFSL